MSFTPLTSANNVDAPTLNAVLTEIDQTRRRMPTGGIVGLQVNISNTGSMSISPGVARDDTDTVDLVRTTAAGNMSVSISAGTGAGKLDTGTISASTWYYVYMIGKVDGPVACLISLSSTSPTLPSGYVYKRRVGVVRTNASSTLYRQSVIGDGLVRRIYWRENTSTESNFIVASAVDVSSSSVYDTLNFAACVPPTAQLATIMLHISSTVANLILYCRFQSIQKHPLVKLGDANKTSSLETDLALSTSQTAEITMSGAGTESLTLYCNGYVDNLACEIV